MWQASIWDAVTCYQEIARVASLSYARLMTSICKLASVADEVVAVFPVTPLTRRKTHTRFSSDTRAELPTRFPTV